MFVLTGLICDRPGRGGWPRARPSHVSWLEWGETGWTGDEWCHYVFQSTTLANTNIERKWTET